MADRDVRVRLSAQVGQYVAAMQAAAAATDRVTASGVNLSKLGGQLQSFGRMATLGLSAPMTAAGVAAVGMSNKFNASFRQMTTLAGMSTSEIDGMRDAVLSLSRETGRGPQELAEALYQASSSGLDARQSMEALTIASKAAAGGLGNTGDIISLVASATAAYGAENMDAAKATDILIGAIRAGSADPDELAGSLGRVLPPAAALGVTFEEVGGAVAFLSTAMGNTDRAITATSGIFTKLQAPTQRGREALVEFGSSMQELQRIIDEDGLLGAMQHLKDIGLADDPLAFQALFDDVEARQGAQAIIGNLEAVETAIGVTKDAVGSGLGDIWDAAQGDPGFEMAQAWAEIQAALIEFGDAVGPIAADIAGAVADIASAFASLPDGVQLAIAGVLIAIGPMASVAGTMMRHAQTIAAARALMLGTGGGPGGFIGPIGPAGQGARFGAIPTAAVLGAAYYNSSDTRDAMGRETWINPNTGRRELVPGQPELERGPIYDFITRDVRGSAGIVPERQGIPQYGPSVPTVGHGMPVDPRSQNTWSMGPGTPFTSSGSLLPAVSGQQAWNLLGDVTAAGGGSAGPTGTAADNVDAMQASSRSAREQAAALREVRNAQDAYAASINNTIDIAAEQYAEFQRVTAATQAYALATSSTDWGAASMSAAQTAMAAYTGESFNLINIAMTTEEAFDRLDAAVEKNGATFETTTEAGRENLGALQGVASALDTQFVAAYENADGSMAKFMWTATTIGNETLGRLQSELGLTDEQTAALAETLGLTATDYEARFELAGDEEAKIRLGLLSGVVGLLQEDVQREVAMLISTGDFQGALDLVQENIAETERDPTVTVTAVDNASGVVSGIQRTVNSLTGKTIYITTHHQTTGDPSYGRSSSYGNRNPRPGHGGGERATAMGGYFDGPDVRLIGEAGAEVVLPLTRPNRMRELLSDPRVMTPLAGVLGGGSSGGGGGSFGGGGVINLVVNAGLGTDGHRVGAQIVDALARHTRFNGPGGIRRVVAV